MQRLLKEYNLEITAESTQKMVNCLDVTLNFKDGTFRPYHKPGDMQYIHMESNSLPPPPPPFPPQILLNIYQPLWKLVYQTYPPLKQYSKNKQHTTKIVSGNLDTITN